jgi:hypothetical protein
MSTLMFETTVTADRQLHCELPASLPIGSKVRVTVEAVAHPVGEDSSPQSELGRTLWAIRQRAVAKGMVLQTVDEILEDIRRDRAEAGDD